jgi:predicted HicB family RNase H-like nuclease
MGSVDYVHGVPVFGRIGVDIIQQERGIMAQVKTKGSAAVEFEGKSIRLELPPDVHQQFRVEAAKEGMSMAAVARRLVEEYLKRKGGK